MKDNVHWQLFLPSYVYTNILYFTFGYSEKEERKIDYKYSLRFEKCPKMMSFSWETVSTLKQESLVRFPSYISLNIGKVLFLQFLKTSYIFHVTQVQLTNPCLRLSLGISSSMTPSLMLQHEVLQHDNFRIFRRKEP